MGLYQKYRPQRLKDFVGNEILKKDLLPFLTGKRTPPKAVLFTGPSGAGKTTLARIYARRIGCSPMDITELDTADFRGIDSIREIRSQMGLATFGGGNRCWILDECHKLTNDAQNALLKALESPPEHVFFVLCTTDPQMVLKTILTRCTQFQVESLSASELVEVLERVCRGEGADIDEDILRQLAKGAGGSPRGAISMLERLLARDPEDYDEVLQSFEGYEVQIRELCQALIAGRAKWKEIAGMIKGIKEEPETVRRSVLGYMNAVLLSGKDSARAAYILDCFKEPYFNTGPAGLTLSCYAGLMQE